ncbi:hypothetical protein D918_04989 [Trichuris suis]|nr:hypothetical protein D918_04989 [Trichuris suis]
MYLALRALLCAYCILFIFRRGFAEYPIVEREVVYRDQLDDSFRPLNDITNRCGPSPPCGPVEPAKPPVVTRRPPPPPPPPRPRPISEFLWTWRQKIANCLYLSSRLLQWRRRNASAFTRNFRWLNQMEDCRLRVATLKGDTCQPAVLKPRPPPRPTSKPPPRPSPRPQPSPPPSNLINCAPGAVVTNTVSYPCTKMMYILGGGPCGVGQPAGAPVCGTDSYQQVVQPQPQPQPMPASPYGLRKQAMKLTFYRGRLMYQKQ